MSAASASDARRVVVCDALGNPLREGGLLEVHAGAGILHKAFSIFVFRQDFSELLLQQRSAHKLLFPLRWANTCCSHPFPDEPLAAAAARRLHEELGFSIPLRHVGAFVYRAADPDRDCSEYEHDSVFVGTAPDTVEVRVDPDEIAAWRWMSVRELQRSLLGERDRYAPWLPEGLATALVAAPAP